MTGDEPTVDRPLDDNREEAVGMEGRLSTRVRWGRRGYVLFAGIFAACVLIQVYIAGMAVFVDPANWNMHMNFVHVFEFIPFIVLVFAFLGQLPRILKLSPIVLFLLIGMQYATAEGFADSLVAAIHPVNAVVIFWVTVLTIRWAWRELSKPATAGA